MPRLQDTATNTAPPIDGGVWVYNLAEDRWDNMRVVALNLEGIADGSVLVSAGGGTSIAYRSPAPTNLSEEATEAGRMMVGDGLDLIDMKGLFAIIGSGPPDVNDGWDGAFWYDELNDLLYGPKGKPNPGTWDTDTTRNFINTVDGKSVIPNHLNIEGTTIYHKGWPKAVELTNFASGAGGVGEDDDSPGYVGLELIITEEASGWVGLRPIGSNPTQVKHIRIGGHNVGGELQNFSGDKYLTESEVDAKVEAGGGGGDGNDIQLSLAANILTLTLPNDTTQQVDLSLYLDDTNLARITSGTLDSGTGIATFERDDESTFTIDLSPLLAQAAFTGATDSVDGTQGAVPQPLAGDEAKALFGDGTWTDVTTPSELTAALAAFDPLDQNSDITGTRVLTFASGDLLILIGSSGLIVHNGQFSGIGGNQTNVFSIHSALNFTTSEPGSPSNNDIYKNTATGTGSITTGQTFTANRLYRRIGTSWYEVTIKPGSRLFNVATGIEERYNGTTWIDVDAGRVHVGASAPSNTSRLWLHSTDKCMYYYDSTYSEWLETTEHTITFNLVNLITSGTGHYLAVGSTSSATSNKRGWPAPYNLKITGIDWRNELDTTGWTHRIAFYDESAASEVSAAYSNSPGGTYRKFSDDGLDVDVDEEDSIGMVGVSGTSNLQYQTCTLTYRRRPT